MSRHMTIAAAMLSVATVGCGFGLSTALAASPQELVDAAYKAMGTPDEKINTLVIKGSLHAWDPGESESVTDPYKPDWGVSTFTESRDRARGLYRIDWVRPRANGGKRNYTEIFSNEI